MWPGDKAFKLRKSNFWERQFFSIVTFKWMLEFALLINMSKLKIKWHKCKFKLDKTTYSKS